MNDRHAPLTDAIAAEEESLAHASHEAHDDARIDQDADRTEGPQTLAALYDALDGESYGVELATLDQAARQLEDLPTPGDQPPTDVDP